MCRAIVYLKAELVATAAARENLEAQCGLLAAAHGYRVEQVVLADPKQPLPYTLDEVLKLGPPALIVPATAHIDGRVDEVLEHCALIVGTPYSYRHRHYCGDRPVGSAMTRIDSAARDRPAGVRSAGASG